MVDRRLITRQNVGKILICEHPTSNKFLNSVAYRGPRLWMDLPSETRNLCEFDCFKKSVKQAVQSEFENMTMI